VVEPGCTYRRLAKLHIGGRDTRRTHLAAPEASLGTVPTAWEAEAVRDDVREQFIRLLQLDTASAEDVVARVRRARNEAVLRVLDV
jgi:hypothetical protein